MEEKRNIEKQARILYTVLAAMLVIIMVISVITAVNKRKDKQTPPVDTDAPVTTAQKHETEPPVTVKVPIIIPDTKAPETIPVTEKPADVEIPVEDEPVSVPRVYVMPTDGEVIKSFSVELPVYSATMNDYRSHTGVDIYAEPGMPVYSFTDGVVKDVYNDPMMGMTVCVDHGDGLVSYYQNMSEQTADGIKAGVKVAAGDALGCVGQTTLVELSDASHLHFEVRRDGRPENPAEYLSALKEANAEVAE